MAIAFFSTWTTYGTWLPGDERGWFARGEGLKEPDGMRKLEAALRLTEEAITLTLSQRQRVEKTIADHCAIRRWTLHAVNCRTNHVHVVLTAPGRGIEIPREQCKAWCSRKLKEQEPLGLPVRRNWWTQRGWDVYIDDDTHLQEAIAYILERQGR
jgi:REP element-mobilizing transposase RayT